MIPATVGRIVHYRLTETDIQNITSGNPVAVGDVLPAIVVRTFDGTLNVNLQVFLDGPDTYWATSRGYSVATQGCWFWPPRIDMTSEGR